MAAVLTALPRSVKAVIAKVSLSLSAQIIVPTNPIVVLEVGP